MLKSCQKIRPSGACADKQGFTCVEGVSGQPATAVIARTDPHEQESAILLPELEHLVP